MLSLLLLLLLLLVSVFPPQPAARLNTSYSIYFFSCLLIVVMSAYPDPDHENDGPARMQTDGANTNLSYESDGESHVGPTILPERIQKVVEQQLTAELERISLENREKDADLLAVKTKREQVGVDLYNAQQQLAKLQEKLELLQDNHAHLQQQREGTEQTAREESARYEKQRSERDEQQKKLERYQSELDRINEMLVQVERYNEEMASKIAVKRRETYKAESDVQEAEKTKKTQDILIDSMEEQIKKAQEELAVIDSQMDAQRQETAAAKGALKDAETEMQAIHFDKKQLLSQWKTSLIGMQRRDEALKSTEEAIHKQKEQLLSMEAEIRGAERQIIQEQEKNGQLGAIVKKMAAENEFLEKQLERISTRIDDTSAKHGMLSKSLESTDKEIEKVDLEAKRVQSSIQAIRKNIEAVNNKRSTLEEDIVDSSNTQTTLKKGSESIGKTISKVNKQIRDKEMELAQVQNEIARIRMDTLTLSSQTESLKEVLDEYEKELSQRSAMIEKYESDIARKHDEIERKQRELDKLNKRYETLMQRKAAQGEAADTGPLEATIRNLTKNIEKSEREADDAQRLWIRGQTDLVSLMNKVNDLSETISSLRAEKTVLENRRHRLETEHQQQAVDMRELSRGMQRLHGEMTRLNEETSKNVRIQESVAEENFNLEGEMEHKFREMEEESVRLKSAIVTTRAEKDQLVQEIVEAEKQLMMWEKKIALSKETAAALDPNVGQDDIIKMKKEIHIMQVRYEQLQRDQKTLVDEMERLIYKRDSIASKGRAAQAIRKSAAGNGPFNTTVSKANLQREVVQRTADLEKEKQAAAGLELQIKDIYLRQHELAESISAVAQGVEDQRNVQTELEMGLHKVSLEKYAVVEAKAASLRSIQKLTEAKDGHYVPAVGTEVVNAELSKAKDKQEKIRQLLSRLRVECPESALQIDKILSTV